MNLLADESVDHPIVDRLRADGHVVVAVAEMAPGIDDDMVLDRANDIGAVLVTADRDFGELVFRQGLVARGVILLRLAGMSPQAKAAVVAAAVTEHARELDGSFTVLSPGHVRIRRAPT